MISEKERRLTVERLKQVVRYDPETGLFYKLVADRRNKVGDVCGSINAKGYATNWVDGVVFQAHRLAWLYMTGAFPEFEVDHRDLVRSNNAWENLRHATHQDNSKNRRTIAQDPTQLKGITADKRRPEGTKRWRSVVKGYGKKIDLGYFYTPQAAHQAYVKAAAELHGEFFRGK